MPVTGDFKKLAALGAAIREIGRPEFRRDMAKALGAAALTELSNQFRAGKDPYGNPWKPPKQRDGNPLLDTRRLEASFSSQPIAKGFEIETQVGYAITHQEGRTIVPKKSKWLRWKTRDGRWHAAKKVTIPKRQMVPEARTGGLGNWGQVLNTEADALMRKVVGQK